MATTFPQIGRKNWFRSKILRKELQDSLLFSIFSKILITRSRHGIGTVCRKILSPRDRVSEFFSPRDSPPKLNPGIPRPANPDFRDPVPDGAPSL